MKKVLLLFPIIFFLALIPVDESNAENDASQVTIKEIENLIEERLDKQKTLTKDELTKAILEMKDEKIADLEGNLSKVLNAAGLITTLTALFLALVTSIIGWIVKKNLDEKLTKIEEKESEINKTYNNIKIKSDSIEEYYKLMKEFTGDLKRTRKKLVRNERLLEKGEIEFENLREFTKFIEDVANK